MSDEKMTIGYDAALAFLKPRGAIHTFRTGSGMLVGADWSRASILEALKVAPEIQVTGDTAQSMGHGLAIQDKHGWVFIETTSRTDEAVASATLDSSDGEGARTVNKTRRKRRVPPTREGK